MTDQIPGVLFENSDNINTVDDLLSYCESRAKESFERHGRHSTILVGKTADNEIAVFDFSGFPMPSSQKQVSDISKKIIDKLGMKLCCFAMETLALEILPNDPNLDLYRKGELQIKDHPDKKHTFHLFVQRPGLCKTIMYSIKKEGEKTSLDDRRELGSGSSMFDFYDHSSIN